MQTLTSYRFSKDGVLVLLLQATCLLSVLALGMVLDNTSALSNLYVTDGMNLLAQAIDDAGRGGIEQIIELATPSAAFLIFNAAIQGISPLLFFCVNSALLLGAIWIFCRGNATNSLLLFLMLPYFWVAASLPSKDILSFALFAVLAYRLSVVTSLIGYAEIVFWSALIFMARDGFGLIVFGASSLIYFGRRLNISPKALVIIALSAAMVLEFVKEEILSYLDIGDRAWIGERSEYAETIATGIGGLFVRLFGNVTNLAFRPVFADIDGGFSALGLAFFVSGLSIVVTFCIFLVKLLSSDSIRGRYIAAFGLACMFALSLAPLVQGRYFMPFVGLVFLMDGISVKATTRYLCVAALISLLASAAYRQMPNYPGLYEIAPFSFSRNIGWQ